MSIDIRKMSHLGFGMMRLPEKDGVIDHEQVCAMVDAYLAAGFNYFDTAYIYHGGKSETAIREALVKRHPRESFWLTDKLPAWVMKSADDRDRILNDQLQRCGVDYFNIYLLHSLEEGGNYETYVKYDCFEWLKRIKAEGKARHIGFSFHGTPELLDKVLTEHPEIEIVQIQLNYLDWNHPTVRSGECYEVLRKHGIPALVMEPVRGGMLANLPDAAADVLKAVHPDASAASWAVRFVGSLEGVATVLSGMSNEAQVADNTATFKDFRPLNEAERAALDKARDIILNANAVPCTACRYCCDGCPAGISIPDVFKALNIERVYHDKGRAKDYYARVLKDGSAPAADCLQCGQCEGVCPQHLGIIELLKEAAEKLG